MDSPKIINNFIWKISERFGSQIVSFIVSIILTRILEPEAYGKIAILMSFIGIFAVFCDSGLGNALIQKIDSDQNDFSTVFFFNVSLCSLICLFLFWGAPFIAFFFNDTELKFLLQALCFTLPLYGIRNIQQAYISKRMLFKSFFYSTLLATIVSAIVGVSYALSGGGAWALVSMQLSYQLTDIFVLSLIVPWFPKVFFSISRLKKLFSFGGRILLSGVLESIYSSLRSLIIGKFYSQESLAFYSKGRSIPDLIGVNINSSIESVMFPVLSNNQNNIDTLKKLTKKTIKLSSLAMFPCLMGLIGVADSLIVILFGQKWVDSIPYLRLFCLYFILFPFHTANLNVIKSLGRSDIILNQELLKKIMGVLLLLISFRFGVMALTISLVIEGIISQIINTWPNKKLIDYGYKEQIIDVFPIFVISFVMSVIVYFCHYLPINLYIRFLVQILIGGIFYLVGVRFADKVFFNFVIEYLLCHFRMKKKNGDY